MKLRLRRHETRETLKLELADSSSLHDLRQRINSSAPSSVHLSLNRKDELLAPSPDDTLRSLGVTSGDLIYYSLDRSAFVASAEEIGLASSGEAHQALAPSGESSDGKLGESEKNQAFAHDSMGIGFAATDVDMNIQDQSKTDLSSGVEDSAAEVSTGENSGMEDPEPMDVEQLDVELAAAGSKRLSEPFFLKKILLEKSGDTSELTTLALSVHAVMLESGFVLYGPGSDKFSFSKGLLSESLRYTLPELITRNGANTIESVTVTFQSLGNMVQVYGTVSGSSLRRVYLDKRRFIPVIDLVMDTLKSDKEGSSSIYREVFMLWRMVKDGLVIPLLIGLCDKAGLELPPCLMRLPTELKLKILESLTGVNVAKMACVCAEMRYLASDNDLWKQKCVEEGKYLPADGSGGDSVNWKARFAAIWRRRRHRRSTPRQNMRDLAMRGNRFGFPWMIRDPYLAPPGSLGQLARGFGGRGWGRSFSPRCNLGGNN